MTVYTRRPHRVEAIVFEKPYNKVREFCPIIEFIRDGNKVVYGILPAPPNRSWGVILPTPVVTIGDYIIKHESGEFTISSEQSFHHNYEWASE